MIDFIRKDGRAFDQIRSCKITPHFLEHNPGSVLMEMGSTKVICSATMEDKVPFFLRNSNQGWLTAEYSMLPSSTPHRIQREIGSVRHGRSVEIQRLIGRSLRMAFDLKKFKEKTIVVDCDVIQADGGTRTASITGAYVAICLAIHHHMGPSFGADRQIASVSIGKVDHMILLDLNYEEDVRAALDINLIMDNQGAIIEIQGTGEKEPFNRKELEEVLDLGQKGIQELLEIQQTVIQQALKSK